MALFLFLPPGSPDREANLDPRCCPMWPGSFLLTSQSRAWGSQRRSPPPASVPAREGRKPPGRRSPRGPCWGPSLWEARTAAWPLTRPLTPQVQAQGRSPGAGLRLTSVSRTRQHGGEAGQAHCCGGTGGQAARQQPDRRAGVWMRLGDSAPHPPEDTPGSTKGREQTHTHVPATVSTTWKPPGHASRDTDSQHTCGHTALGERNLTRATTHVALGDVTLHPRRHRHRRQILKGPPTPALAGSGCAGTGGGGRAGASTGTELRFGGTEESWRREVPHDGKRAQGRQTEHGTREKRGDATFCFVYFYHHLNRRRDPALE